MCWFGEACGLGLFQLKKILKNIELKKVLQKNASIDMALIGPHVGNFENADFVFCAIEFSGTQFQGYICNVLLLFSLIL